MKVDYLAFVARLIGKYEGGYGWDKKDPGGPTKYGITCYDLAEHRGLKMTSMVQWAPLVQQMSLAEAEAIYQTKYANYINFDVLPAGADVAVLDYAVNSGIARGVLVTRELLGIKGTGALTPGECAMVGQYGAKKFVDDMCAERLRFMHAIRGGSAWVEFGHGWQARVDDLRAYGDHLAAGSTPETAPVAVDLSHVTTPKAIHVPNTAAKTTTGGVVVAAGAAYASGVPWYGALAAGVAVLAAGIAYEAYEAHVATQANTLVHA